MRGHQQRQPAALGDLQDVGGEEGLLDQQQRHHQRATFHTGQPQQRHTTKNAIRLSMTMVAVTDRP